MIRTYLAQELVDAWVADHPGYEVTEWCLDEKGLTMRVRKIHEMIQVSISTNPFLES